MSLFLCAQKVHVVGDEKLPGAGDRGAPRGDEGGRAIFRGPFALFQLHEGQSTKGQENKVNLF